MKKIIIIFAIVVIAAFWGFSKLGSATANVYADFDRMRLEHLAYWSGVVEEYHAKTGFYPLQDILAPGQFTVMTRILTKDQRAYVTKGGKDYNELADNNPDGHFPEIPVNAFIAEIEKKLGRAIPEKYDPQKVPTRSPIGYYYFATANGYVLWTTCTTCGVTQISTLLMDGYTPTVNIVSPGMAGKVTKALPRADMLAHPTFKGWMDKGYKKEDYMRQIEQLNSSDSKQ